MGKKLLNQVLKVKISKNNTTTTSTTIEKKQLINSLIKVVKPKVYIIDSSSFKTLVQQLTGNGTTSSTPPSSISNHHDLPQIVEEVVLPTAVEDHDHHHHHHHSPESSSSMEYSSSFDASVDDSFLVDSNHLTDQIITHHQAAYDPFPFVDAMSTNWSSGDLLMNNNDNLQLMKEDSLVCGDHDLQSLLLDVDDDEQILYPNYSTNSFNNYVCSHQISQQEVSIYDYELSGLIY